jgi:hypothetical protein
MVVLRDGRQVWEECTGVAPIPHPAFNVKSVSKDLPLGDWSESQSPERRALRSTSDRRRSCPKYTSTMCPEPDVPGGRAQERLDARDRHRAHLLTQTIGHFLG